MTRSIELDRLVSAYFESETTAPAPDGLLESVLEATSRRRPQLARPGWAGRMDEAGGAGARGWAEPGLWTGGGVRWLAIALLAVAAVVGVGALGVGREGLPSPTQSPLPASDVPFVAPLSELPRALAGDWVADQPTSLRFTDPSGPQRMTLSLSTTAALRNNQGEKEWLRSDVTATTTTVRFVTRSESEGSRTFPTDGVAVDVPGRFPYATILPVCAQGDVGTYTWAVAPEARTLVLAVVSEACPAREAVYADRVWTRSETTTVSGSLLMDLFTPAFTVTLPAAEYQISETNAHVDIVGGTVDLAAFLGPQAMRDFCDARGGPIDMAPGGEGFIAAFTDRPEFSITRHPDRLIDGLPATRLTLTAGRDWCEGANLKAWFPPLGAVWQFSPGEDAELAIVMVDGKTVMFQLGVSSPPESTDAFDRILDSIVFVP